LAVGVLALLLERFEAALPAEALLRVQLLGLLGQARGIRKYRLAEAPLLLGERLFARELVEQDEGVVELVLGSEPRSLLQQENRADVPLENLLEAPYDLGDEHRLLEDDRVERWAGLRASLLHFLDPMSVGAVIIVLAVPTLEEAAELRFVIPLVVAARLLLLVPAAKMSELLHAVGEIALVRQVAGAVLEVATEHRLVLRAQKGLLWLKACLAASLVLRDLTHALAHALAHAVAHAHAH